VSIINEDLARQAKHNRSYNDYVEGSATEEYNSVILGVKERIESAKERVSAEGIERLDKLFSSYCVRYADWVNKSNANGARHVSAMISGGSNYDMRKHEKFLSRETSLWKEYQEIQEVGLKIQAIIRGDKIIKSDASDATDQLTAKIEELQKAQDRMKFVNAYYRKNNTLVGCEGFSEETARQEDERIKNDYSWCRQPYPSFTLTNHNAKIRAAKERLEQLSKLKEKTSKETVVNGIRVVENIEEVRIQLFFDGKPETEMRNKLKANGFRWAPSVGAWQRQLNNSGIYAARRILEIQKTGDQK
jgi:hypothetical protein